MNTAMQVLVIIVSATLSLFLLLGIVLIVYVIKMVHSLRRIIHTAETLAVKAEMVGDLFGRAAAPAAIGRLITNLADNVFKHSNKGKKESD